MATTATTFSENYQIKLIGTGLESGTWGLSTNQNMERIEQALGGSKLLFDVEVPGGGSSYDDDTNTLEWITSDTAAAGAPGSEGRNKFVEFSGAVDGNVIVQIRGSINTEFPDRIYFVKNSLTPVATTITFDMGGAAAKDYVLQNGCCAVIYTDGATSKVDNLLATLQVENITFGDEEGPAPADITIKANDATALEIKDSVGALLTFDTTTDETEVAITSNYITGTASGTNTNKDVIFTSAKGDVSLVSTEVDVNITAGADVNLTGAADVNLEATANVAVVAPTAFSVDTPTIDLTTGATDIDLPVHAYALEIRTDPDLTDVNMMIFDGTEDAERVVVPIDLVVGGTADLESGITLATDSFSLKSALGATNSDVMFMVDQPTELGGTDTNFQGLTAVVADVSNSFYVRDYVVRDGTGSDWTTARYRRGVAIDTTGHTPAALKSWYQLNPDASTISFGAVGVTHGSMGPSGLLLEAASDYLNFDGVAGSTGIGIRSLLGVLQSKDLGGEWGPLNDTSASTDTTTGGGKLTGDTTTTVLVTDTGTSTRLTGDRVTIRGQTTGTDAGLTPSQINGTFYITAVGATTYNITMPAAASAEVFGDSTMSFQYFDRSTSAIEDGFALQGQFDIGQLRFIFNKIDAIAAPVITLGDNVNGTPFTMASQLFLVLGVQVEDDTATQGPFIATVVQPFLKVGAITFRAGPNTKTREITYLCIGDSGV